MDYEEMVLLILFACLDIACSVLRSFMVHFALFLLLSNIHEGGIPIWI